VLSFVLVFKYSFWTMGRPKTLSSWKIFASS